MRPLLLLAALAAACAPSPLVHPRAAEELRRGYAHLAAGDGERAEVAFEHALEFAPDLAEGWNGLGVVARWRGDLPAARQRFARAVRLAPELADGLANLGEALLAEERLDAAREALRAALRLQPDLAGARLNLARALLQDGLLRPEVRSRRWTEARREYLHLLEARPEDAPAHQDLAFMDYLSGRPAAAEAGYRAAVRQAPSPEALLGLCLSLVRLERCAEAREACDRCLELDPAWASCRETRRIAEACAE
jgi:tetratricopeptide (TPR) repeat protein